TLNMFATRAEASRQKSSPLVGEVARPACWRSRRGEAPVHSSPTIFAKHPPPASKLATSPTRRGGLFADVPPLSELTNLLIENSLGQRFRLIEHQIVIVVGCDDENGILPAAVRLHPLADDVERHVAAVDGADHAVDVVGVLGP